MWSPPPQTLRNLSNDELAHMFSRCGDPLIESFAERLIYHAPDCECEFESDLEEANEALEKTQAELVDAVNEKNKLREALSESNDEIEKLRQQVRNLGGRLP